MKPSVVSNLLRHIWLPCGVSLALFVWAFASSLLVLKKVIALLLLPSGWVWLGLLALAGWPGLHGRCRAAAVAMLLVFTLAGNPWFGGWLLGTLERPYAGTPGPRVDVLCVLGGGTGARPDGEPQLGPAGDRVMTAARWFLTHKTGHLVTSGLNVTDVRGKRSLADDTARIWSELGIPDSAVTRLSEPRTTREEIRAYKRLAAERDWRRVGVCSSAWHLRRVETLGRREGLQIIPVPSDFLSTPLPWNAMYAVPQARGFQNVQKALWEYLGAATGG